MSVTSNSITIFVVDISASMGSERVVHDKVSKRGSGVEIKERTTTDLQWVCEFISARLAEIILRGLKTTKVALITFGSTRTNNLVTDENTAGVVYEGVDEVLPLQLPDLDTLDLVRNLRAVDPDDNAPEADPLAALVDAIQLSNTPHRGGIKDNQKLTWSRTIYLITDGRSHFSWDGADAIKERVKDEGIEIRVLGVDFDDAEYGFKEERKDSVKRANEEFWHEFLADNDRGRIATALDAIEQASLPNVQLTKPSLSKSLLTFGDPNESTSRNVLAIPIGFFKMTEIQKPLKQSKISKLAQESEGAQAERQLDATRMEEMVPSSTPIVPKIETRDGEMVPVPTYRADIKREHFLLEDVVKLEKNKGQNPKPLPEGSVDNFTKAWKLGASLIPVSDEAFGTMDTSLGCEILHFTRRDTYCREFNLGSIWFVFADFANKKAQIELSALIQALHELELIAVVRRIKKNGAEPELGVLWPCIEAEYECFYYSPVPFREDYRRFIFPPLDRIITKEGTELFAGPSIPTKEDQQLFDQFVDDMDLMNVDGQPWHSILDSFNPAIHVTKDAVKYRFIHPDSKDIPAPQPELTKYLRTPREVAERSQEVVKKCKERFKNNFIPPKSDFAKKRWATREDGGGGHGDKNNETKKPRADDQQQQQQQREAGASTKTAERSAPTGGEDSETEDEDAADAPSRSANADADTADDNDNIKEEAASQGLPPTQPSARIGTTNPVESFLDLVKSEDDVTRLFIEMLDTISYLLRTREYDKVVQCCKEAKRVAQEYEEAIRWNIYIRQLKEEAVSKHLTFWNQQMEGRLDLGLVTEDEDEAGQSDVSKEAAREFVQPDNGDQVI